MSLEEEWRRIPWAPNILVSNLGRFVNGRTGEPKKATPNKNGYLYVPIYVEGRTQIISGAKIVAEVFIPEYDDRRRIRYRDGNPGNIAADNLICQEPLEEYTRNYAKPRKHAVRVRIVELDKVFLSGRAAAAYIDGWPSAVYACLRGEHRHHLGYTFEYVTTREMLEYQRRRDADAGRS